jgi:hypothetical protein
MPSANPAQETDETLIDIALFRSKPRDGAADVAFIELRVSRDRAGKEALAERAKRDHADAEFLEHGKDLVLGLARPGRVFALQGNRYPEEHMRRVGL